jgi:hypothetical protein
VVLTECILSEARVGGAESSRLQDLQLATCKQKGAHNTRSESRNNSWNQMLMMQKSHSRTISQRNMWEVSRNLTVTKRNEHSLAAAGRPFAGAAGAATCIPTLPTPVSRFSLSRTRLLSGRSLSSTLLLVIMAYLRHCLLISLCAPRTAPHLLINYCFIIALIFIILLLKNVPLLSLQFKLYAI